MVWNNADFNSIIPDIGTRYDVGISSFTPTATREKTVDFVTYYQAGESWLVNADGPQIHPPPGTFGPPMAHETGPVEGGGAHGLLGHDPAAPPGHAADKHRHDG